MCAWICFAWLKVRQLFKKVVSSCASIQITRYFELLASHCAMLWWLWKRNRKENPKDDDFGFGPKQQNKFRGTLLAQAATSINSMARLEAGAHGLGLINLTQTASFQASTPNLD
jgi:hypothetical protein